MENEGRLAAGGPGMPGGFWPRIGAGISRHSGGGGGAGDDPRHLGMYSFRIERIHPQTPEEKFWGDCEISPQTPLKRPKEGPVGPSFGNHPGDGRGYGYGGITLGAFGRTVGGGLCPAPGRAFARDGAPCGRFAAHRASNGNPINHRGKICYTRCFSFRATPLRWRWRSGRRRTLLLPL